MERYKAYNGDCTELMKTFDSESVDIILTDPPYLYLKNQKLDKEFDEETFFNEAKRVLKKDGFIILFGRGTSFYRWNTMLADLGFKFKEEVVWDKSHNTSPLMALSRIHETVSIHTKGNGKINKVKVPYLEMKSHDLDSIITDVKRLKTTFKNTKSLNAVLDFLENNQVSVSDGMNEKSIIRTDKYVYKNNSVVGLKSITKPDRAVSVMQSINKGMSERTIIRADFEKPNNPRKGVTAEPYKPTGDRACNVMQSIEVGMNEKTIIKEVRDHRSAIHPTQKPVRLLERLLALVLPKDIEKPIVLDPFAGSFSTGVASINMGCYPILIELDKEYYEDGKERFLNEVQQLMILQTNN